MYEESQILLLNTSDFFNLACYLHLIDKISLRLLIAKSTYLKVILVVLGR